MGKLKNWRLLGVILVPSLILVLLAFFYYNSEAENINIEKKEYLTAVNSLKIDQILQWRKERLSTATFFPTVGKFINFSSRLSENKNNQKAEKYFNQSLLQFKSNHYFENIFITDASGALLYSFDSSYQEVEEETILNIKSAIEGDSVFFGDFYYNKEDEAVYFNLISPFKDNKGIMIGAIVQSVNPAYNLFPLIEKWPTQSKTAETLLFMKKKDKVLFLTDFKHEKSSALLLSISLKDTDVIAVKGALGAKGIIEGKDYRGKEVLAYLNVIPRTNWFIITKIDKDEIYSDIIFRGKTILLIVIISMLTLVFGTLYLYKSKQSRIYKELFLKEKQIFESQEEFRTTLYSIGDGVITTDASGRIKQVNKVAENMTGWRESDAQGKILNEVFNILNEDTRLKIENPVQKVMNEGVLVHLANHTLLISRQGKEIPITDSGSPIKDDDGKIIGIVLVFSDKTEARAKEKILIENEERLRLSLYAANQGLYDVNVQTGDAVVNDEYVLMLGYDPKTFVETDSFWIERLHPDDKDKSEKAYRDYIEGRISEYKVEFRQRTKNNEWKWILSMGKIIEYDDQKKPLRMLGTHTDITERKQMETELKESELRYRILTEYSPVGIFRTDSSGGTVYVNPRWCEISKLSFKEAVGDSWLNAVHPEDKNMLIEGWKKAASEAISSKEEYRFLHKDGTVTWVLGYAVPLKNDMGSVIGYIGTITDITKRKESEEALRLSEAKLNESQKVARLGHYNFDIAKGTWTNSRMLDELFGIDKSFTRDIAGWTGLIHPDDRGQIIDYLQKQVLNQKNKFDKEYRIIRHSDKKEIWVHGLGDLEFDTEGKSIEMFGTIQDITNSKRIEETLRKLSQVVEQSNVSIMITDKEGRIEYINPKYSEVSGYSFEEVAGQNPRIIKSGNQSNELYEEMWNTILSGKNWQGEIQNRKKNGELFWEWIVISPIVNKAGSITHFVAIKEDVTDKKKMIEELIKAKENAEEMNKVKSYFFASMSHELRTPFVGILGFAELLEETLTNSEEKEFASQILKSSKRLIQTLNKILDISLLESTEPVLNLTDLDVNELVTETGEMFVQYAKVNNTAINIKAEFAGGKIISDKKLLEAILSNLVNNAVKFTHNGIIEITSKKISVNETDHLEIKVTDTGIGIPKEKQAIIWQEFRQVSEGYNRSFEGTGLGLTITKKYIDALSGKIHLESEEGKGSVFTLELPVTFSKI